MALKIVLTAHKWLSFYLRYIMYNPPSPDAADEELEKLCPWDHGCQEALAKMQQQHQESILNVD